MKKIVNVRKAIKGLTMALALSMALNGCSFGDKTNSNNNHNESSYEVQTDDIIEESHDHTHVHENVIDDIQDEKDNDISQDIKDEVDRKSIVSNDNKDTKIDDSAVVINENAIYDEMGNLIIPDLSVQFNTKVYTENSIIKALKLAGYNSSYEYRALLAEHFGIEKYRGTANQNLLLLDYLRHPEYFLGQDDLSHGDENSQNTGQNSNYNFDNNNGQGNGNNGNGNGNNGNSNENNGNGGNGNGNGSGDHDHEDQGKWEVISTVATSYSEIAGDDDYHYTTYTTTYRHTKTGKIRTETRTVRETHNYLNDTCKNCKHEKTKEQEKHNLVGSISKSYRDNGASGHTVTETQYCSTHNEYEVVNTYVEAHTPGEWKVNPDNPNEEIQVCTKGACGHIVSRRPVQSAEHNRTGEIRKEYEEKDKNCHTVKEYQYCETHKKEELVNTYEEGHNLGAWEVDPLDPTKEIQVCKDCGEIVNIRDKEIQDCKHENTSEKVTYEYVDANGHKKTITVYCDDCHEIIGTPTTEVQTHTPTNTTTSIEKGTADRDGHYVVTTNTYDCCGEHTLDAVYVGHGDESYTQVGEVSYTQLTQDGVDGHIETIAYKYEGCEYTFTIDGSFTPCTNVDGFCTCGREMSHSHNMHWESITLTEEEAKTYCSKGANACNVDGCTYREEPIYVKHGDNGYARVASTDPDDAEYDLIICATGGCEHVVDRVKKVEDYNGPYGSFGATQEKPGEVDPWASFVVSEDASKTTEVVENVAETKDIKENEEEPEKVVEKSEEELYNEYIEIVDSYIVNLQKVDDEEEKVEEEVENNENVENLDSKGAENQEVTQSLSLG